MIFTAGISIAVFFEFLLVFKKNKTLSDKILIIWLFLISVHMFLFSIYYTEESFNYPFLLGIGLPLPLIQGVMLYLYVASSTHQLPKNKNVLFVHFIPATAAYIYLIPFFFLPADEKIFIYKNEGVGYEVFMTILIFSFSILAIVYQAWTIILLNRHKKKIENQFSDIEKINLNWLRIMIWGMGIIWFVVIIFQTDVYNFITIALFVFAIGFFGIRQIGVFPQNQEPTGGEERKEKYSKSGLKGEFSLELYEKLKQLMENEKMYTKNDLVIQDLATKLDVHPNYLSQVINEKGGRNFYEFINNYRVEEFKRLLNVPKNQQLTLLSLAFECGFNSKSSFNRYFKKSTGQTPSQYYSLTVNG